MKMFALMCQQLVEVSVAHLCPPAAGQGASSALLCPRAALCCGNGAGDPAEGSGGNSNTTALLA